MRLVYRADTRPPAEIFTLGFKPRFSGGIQIQPGGQMIGGISTSKDITIAMNYASLYGGYVYALHTDETAIDVVEELFRKRKHAALPNAYTQMEIACNAIPANQILMARKVVRDSYNYMSWEGAITSNPNYVHIEKLLPETKTAQYLFNLNTTFKAPH